MTDSSLGALFPIDRQRILRRDRHRDPSLIACPGKIRETFPEMPGVFPLPRKPDRVRKFGPNQGIAANTRIPARRMCTLEITRRVKLAMIDAPDGRFGASIGNLRT
ncbi:MAG TPA: hypothetical protein PLL14_09795 [Accumulibacter sp.]|nr:hypothetical protein [Accumulibacter sp.]